jgi:DNA-binding MarR family transcriptional regulator
MPPLPLSSDEELAWRALLRIVVSLPRKLDEDLVRAAGMSLTEYTALMSLSEASCRRLRMGDLAIATGLSASRVSRIVDDLCRRGLVDRQRSNKDGRRHFATLTPAGLTKLEGAYPEHLASARRRVVDQIDPELTTWFAATLAAIAKQLPPQTMHGRRS